MAIKRGFSSFEEHDEHIILEWNKVVNKKDVTYILGDITMEKVGPYPLLDRLKGNKHVILGNHDMRQHTKELAKYVNSICSVENYKGVIFLTHIPVHPIELGYRVKLNIHGHLHDNIIQGDDRYINVCCEQPHINYSPKTLVELGVNINELWKKP
jgi:calcineurin-like phosphoesterase family protein